MSFDVQPLLRPGEFYADYLLFEQGQYSRPVAILSYRDMCRITAAFAEFDPVSARAAVAIESKDGER
jgi:hypothetical protein